MLKGPLSVTAERSELPYGADHLLVLRYATPVVYTLRQGMRIAQPTGTVLCPIRIHRGPNPSPIRHIQVYLQPLGTTAQASSRLRYQATAFLKRLFLGHALAEVIATVLAGPRAAMAVLHITIEYTRPLLETPCHATLPEIHPKR